LSILVFYCYPPQLLLTGATSEVETAYPSGAHEVTPGFSGVRVARYLFLCSVLYIVACPFSFDHCVVCPSLIYRLWLPLWYLLTIVLCVLLRFTDYDYPFGIFWPLCCLSFFDLQIMITPLVSFDHCGVCPSSIYRLWLPLWYLLTIVVSVHLRFTYMITPLVSSNSS
jgi:hypothetical protein